MLFGIRQAPELFQRRLQSAIDDLPEVYTIADDVLIVGEGDTHEIACQDHDKKLAFFGIGVECEASGSIETKSSYDFLRSNTWVISLLPTG